MSLLQMSFSGAILILMIVIARALLIDKLPKKTFLVLWMVALVRLLVPFSLPSMASIYTLVQTNTPAMESVGQTPVSQFLPVQMPEQVQETAPGRSVLPARMAAPLNVWIILWAMGALLCLGFFVVTYVKCYRNFQMSLPVENETLRRWYNTHPSKRQITIRQSDMISAPLSYGILHPVILMPKATNWEDTAQLSYVLEHEYVHIRRFDAVTKLVVIAALSLHWFNPLVWVLYILLNRDIELSCDEAVVRRFGENVKSAYAMTLINMEEKKSGLTPLCNSFSKNAIEERIRSIMKIRKISFLTSVLAIVLVIGITSTFATSAAISEFDGSRTGNESQLVLEYKMLNKTDSQELKLEKGDTVKFNVVNKSGSLAIVLCKEDGEVVYEGSMLVTSTFQVEIEESGTYTVSVTGKKTRGSVSVIVERPQAEETDSNSQAAFGEASVGYDQEAITARLTELNLLIDKADTEDPMEIEAAKEEKYTLEGMLEDLERQNFFETAYGDFGVSYQLPENRLYKDGRSVMGFYDEQNGGSLWWDNDGEIYVEVIRNNAGEILRLFEGDAGESQSEQSAANSENSVDHKAVRDLVYNIAHGEQFPEYEKFGLSYDEDNGYLMYDGKTVGYFKDEIKPGSYTRYSDETGELGVVVIRDEAGEILALQVDPVEEALNAQPAPFEYRAENSDSQNDIIGGAEGMTSIYVADKSDNMVSEE